MPVLKSVADQGAELIDAKDAKTAKSRGFAVFASFASGSCGKQKGATTLQDWRKLFSRQRVASTPA